MAIRVRGYSGVAFLRVRDESLEPGRAKVCMVGDDRIIEVDEDDCEPLKDSEYCYECGQIGCRCSVLED